MADKPNPLARAGLIARAAPFAAAMALAPLAVLLPDGADSAPALVAGAALTLVIAIAVVAVPWTRAPEWTAVLPPLAYVGAIALLRHGDGGAASELAPLALLPVAWIALHGRAWQVAVVVGAVAAAFVVPIAAIGGSFYPDSEWRRAAVWVAIAVVVGYAIQRLMSEIERQADESRRGLDERLRAERRLRLESDVTRVLAESASPDEALARCVDALGRGLGFNAGLLWRPDPSAGELRCVAAWQLEPGSATAVAAASRATGIEKGDGLVGRVWSNRAAEWVEDCRSGESVRSRAAAEDGLAAALAVPVASERELHAVVELLVQDATALNPDLVATAGAIGAQVGQYVERRHAERAVFENAENIAAVLEATRELARSASGTEARAAICDAALKVSGGVLGALFEPDPDARGLVTTAARGQVPAMFRDAMLPFVGQRAAEVQAFTAGEPLFVEDTLDHPLVAKELEQRGVRSCLYQPVLRDGRSVGVLMVAWGRKAARLSPRLADVIALLAAEAAVAIERADLLARLEAIARTDDLTGLANRRAWDELLPTELARAARDGTPLCVAMLDLDRFKAFNDENGHQAGDRLLKSAAGRWRASLRATDVLARYGGEEFALVLPRCDVEDALVLLDRLRAETPQEQTVSAGIALWEPGEAAEALVARADAALYDAKNSGRDRVVVASQSESTV